MPKRRSAKIIHIAVRPNDAIPKSRSSASKSLVTIGNKSIDKPPLSSTVGGHIF